MPSNKDIFDTGLTAGTNLSAETNRNRGVRLTSSIADGDGGTVALSNTLGEAGWGILTNLPDVGEPAKVLRFGLDVEFVAGANITAGAALTQKGDGTFQTAASGNFVVGTARQTVNSGAVCLGDFNFINPGKA